LLWQCPTDLWRLSVGARIDPLSVNINPTITYKIICCDTNRLKIGD
jgi:hypothetical protein